MKLTRFFEDMVVLEWGKRPAVRACGGLLAQLGARVSAFDTAGHQKPLARFKTILDDTETVRSGAFDKANVVIFSSDRLDEAQLPARRRDQIFLNITVDDTGKHGHWPDPLLQAASGITDITGTKDSPPTISDAPIVESQTAIFAAAGIVVAWPRLAETGEGQDISLSLVDCALNNLSSFLPLVFAGKTPLRSGNRHPMAVPWNSYKASDGWILLCSATDDHWVKLCALMGREELSKGRFEKLADRVENCDLVDAEVESWTSSLSVNDCIAALNGAGLAAGPILELRDLPGDPNLAHRESIEEGIFPAPLSFLKTDPAADCSDVAAARKELPARPLDGLRVIEIGQYTTAPLASKQLALLGADVIKIEPPGGEASRAWPPHQDGQGYFFTMNNANKRSCLLDLRQDDDRDTFAYLLKRSDVLVENMKPGSLERLGFSPEELSRLNPRLVYCGISGFGKNSAYPDRPAFDTVVQAMSGLMDATRANGTPLKLGISAADVTGGIAGLFAIMCGLEQRRRTGRGVFVDLSMQDVAVWVTQTLWSEDRPSSHAVLACEDGFVVAVGDPVVVEAAAGDYGEASRRDLIEILRRAGIVAGSVRTLEEIAADPACVGNGTVEIFTDDNGKSWPLFRSPYQFSKEGLVGIAPIGELGAANADIIRQRQRETAAS